jgi:hypothetical protein
VESKADSACKAGVAEQALSAEATIYSERSFGGFEVTNSFSIEVIGGVNNAWLLTCQHKAIQATCREKTP